MDGGDHWLGLGKAAKQLGIGLTALRDLIDEEPPIVERAYVGQAGHRRMKESSLPGLRRLLSKPFGPLRDAVRAELQAEIAVKIGEEPPLPAAAAEPPAPDEQVPVVKPTDVDAEPSP